MTTVREARRHTLPARPAPPAERRPFRDNPRLILLGIVLLFARAGGDDLLADKSSQLNPDFLSEVLLYALSAADLTMVVALVFVLARNIVKLFVERRRGLPFSRFRAKLVMALLGLTIVPSLLVLAVGGELIRSVTQLGSVNPSMTCCGRPPNWEAATTASTKASWPTMRSELLDRFLPLPSLRATSKRFERRLHRRSRRGGLTWSRCIASPAAEGPRRSSRWNRPLVPRGHPRELPIDWPSVSHPAAGDAGA